jgi:Flp pilus assembly protein TadD
MIVSAWNVTAVLAEEEAAPPEGEKTAVPSEVTLRAQLGIIYAQNGQRESARVEFVKLLEVPEGRSIALTNLGNLALIDGRLEEALASYQQASALEATDPGILLNAGLAYKLLGQTEDAEIAFASAVEMAGGVEQASYLLGLHTVDDTGRGKASKMTADELRQMLVKAKTQVPETEAKKKDVSEKNQVTSRPGGARASEAVGDLNLYWKDN